MHLAIDIHEAAWNEIEDLDEDAQAELRAAICNEIETGYFDDFVRAVADTAGRAELLSTGHLVVFAVLDADRLREYNDRHGTGYEEGIELFDVVDAFRYIVK